MKMMKFLSLPKRDARLRMGFITKLAVKLTESGLDPLSGSSYCVSVLAKKDFTIRQFKYSVPVPVPVPGSTAMPPSDPPSLEPPPIGKLMVRSRSPVDSMGGSMWK
jgi:hypothetical protein